MHTVWSYLVFASSYGHVPGAVNGLNTGGRCMVCVCEGVRGGRCKGGGQGGVFLTFLHLVVIA